MTTVAEARSKKTSRDENFPVASRLVSARFRAPILAFYRFARAADDVADHAELSADEKLRLLDRLGEALCGGPSEPDAEPLRLALRERGLAAKHALDLLDAFRLDARKSRYANWAELVDYCRLSAMPVGRFVLDVHEQSRDLWPASDDLCVALQVNNHLQDCAADFRRLDRVYLPLDVLDAHGASVEMLAEPCAPPPLRAAIVDLAERSETLARGSASLVFGIADARLSLEIGAVQSLAVRIARLLRRRDPLSERVHLSKFEFICAAIPGVVQALPGAAWRAAVREGRAARA